MFHRSYGHGAVGVSSGGNHPFGGEIRDGKLYGRGASDMKSGLAAIAAAGTDLLLGSSPRL